MNFDDQPLMISHFILFIAKTSNFIVLIKSGGRIFSITIWTQNNKYKFSVIKQNVINCTSQIHFTYEMSIVDLMKYVTQQLVPKCNNNLLRYKEMFNCTESIKTEIRYYHLQQILPEGNNMASTYYHLRKLNLHSKSISCLEDKQVFKQFFV